MRLTDEQAITINNMAGEAANKVLNTEVVYKDRLRNAQIASGRAAFEDSMRIALECPRDDEVLKAATDAFGPGRDLGYIKKLLVVFLGNRIASYYQNQDRTTERLQKWFETHGHPEFCLDPQPLEQLAAIVIDEYEKRKNVSK